MVQIQTTECEHEDTDRYTMSHEDIWVHDCDQLVQKVRLELK